MFDIFCLDLVLISYLTYNLLLQILIVRCYGFHKFTFFFFSLVISLSHETFPFQRPKSLNHEGIPAPKTHPHHPSGMKNQEAPPKV